MRRGLEDQFRLVSGDRPITLPTTGHHQRCLSRTVPIPPIYRADRPSAAPPKPPSATVQATPCKGPHPARTTPSTHPLGQPTSLQTTQERRFYFLNVKGQPSSHTPLIYPDTQHETASTPHLNPRRHPYDHHQTRPHRHPKPTRGGPAFHQLTRLKPSGPQSIAVSPSAHPTHSLGAPPAYSHCFMPLGTNPRQSPPVHVPSAQECRFCDITALTAQRASGDRRGAPRGHDSRLLIAPTVATAQQDSENETTKRCANRPSA